MIKKSSPNAIGRARRDKWIAIWIAGIMSFVAWVGWSRPSKNVPIVNNDCQDWCSNGNN